jgi:phosphoribosylanthranilate isomerase
MQPCEGLTITGADDSVTPEALVMVAQAYPGVEWGILLSCERHGEPRYPSASWLRTFEHVVVRERLHASLHLCGLLVRELVRGIIPFPSGWLAAYQRIQLNVGQVTIPQAPSFTRVVHRLAPDIPCIFQLRLLGTLAHAYFEAYCADYGGRGAAILFDQSGGKGVLPAEWLAPFARNGNGSYVAHGYAGGLTPENLRTELPRIAAAAGRAPWWVDLETGVRTDERFDLEKVLATCEAYQAFRLAPQKERDHGKDHPAH